MSVIIKLKEDIKTAQMEKDFKAANYLRTIYAEMMMVGKNAKPPRETTEAEAVKSIQKTIAGVKENIDLASKAGRDISAYETELKTLEKYIPRQMTEDELKAAVEEIVAALPEKNAKAMGTVMAQLKEKAGGLYDGKIASAIVKAALQ